MSQLAALKAATTLKHVAPLLGYEPKALSYILYKLPPSLKYSHFEIPKRFGGTRKISAPAEHVKFLQKRLSDFLQNCLKEIEEAGGRKSSVSHGFKKDRSIISNAKYHRGRRYVFNVDLEDFFPSIHFGRVRGFFIKDRNFALNENVATVLAQIACHDNALPQGSPCSPVISNLVGHVLDTHLVRLALDEGCRYTRYADDLTFSTNELDFPKCIAERTGNTEHDWVPGNKLVTIVARSGFKINPSKTRMQYCDSRQEVTGLVVNRKVNVRSEYRHLVRAMTHRLLTKGEFEFVHESIDASGTKATIKIPGKPQQLHGMLGFIDWIDSYNKKLAEAAIGPTAPSTDRQKLTTKESIYRRFLLFNQFYTAPMPVLLCEGRTDNIYLVHAIRSLADQFPALAMKNADGKITFKIRIYKYSKSRKRKARPVPQTSSTGRILGINGGSGDLKNFLFLYRNEVQRFKAPGAYQPVILLIDNDQGAGAMNNSIKEVTKTTVNKVDPFIHVYRNLYVVPTPLKLGEQESTIESFFDAKTRAETIDNKTFNPGKDFDPDKHYGKQVFAQKIVKEKADKIDFSGFTQLLSNISLVIEAHVQSHPQPSKTT